MPLIGDEGLARCAEPACVCVGWAGEVENRTACTDSLPGFCCGVRLSCRAGPGRDGICEDGAALFLLCRASALPDDFCVPEAIPAVPERESKVFPDSPARVAAAPLRDSPAADGGTGADGVFAAGGVFAGSAGR